MQLLDIHPKKISFLNSEAIRVAALLKRLDELPKNEQVDSETGSFMHLESVDLGQFDGPVIYNSYDSLAKGKLTAIKSCQGTVCIGYDTKGYIEFLKLTSATNKEKAVNESISTESIEKAAFSWAINHHSRDTDSNTDYVSFLSEFIQNRTDTYRIYFPIINLHIKNFFRIGNVEFVYFTQEHINKISKSITFDNPNYPDPDIIVDEFNKYKGRVFATCCIKAEKDKAVELAFKQCALAIDVLKTCSRVTLEPIEAAGFDIDSRVKFTQRSEILLTKPHDMSEFEISMNVTQFPYQVDESEWDNMLDLGLKIFSDFLLDAERESTELKDLIISSLSRYSNALAEKDMHRRVVELYTILESLLLKDENSPIIDSVAKYLVMLIETDKGDRYECAHHIRSMYKVRSNLIHHAKKIDFTTEDLKKLQLYVVSLLHNLIIRSKTHKQKRSMLAEIDDIIMSA